MTKEADKDDTTPANKIAIAGVKPSKQGRIRVFGKQKGKPSKKKKIKSGDFFHTSQTPPLPPLKCGNTFWGKRFLLQFHPENDLPTHKNWIK